MSSSTPAKTCSIADCTSPSVSIDPSELVMRSTNSAYRIQVATRIEVTTSS